MNPLEYFFNLGNKFTGNNIKKKADWDFYLLIIMFMAFLSVLIGNVIDFYHYQKLANLGWAFVMLAILWFQYFGLKAAYDLRKMLKNPVKPESQEEMFSEFKKEAKKNE